MLPKTLSLTDLDEGVKDLVINLNRIPGVYTNTTCESHIFRDCPAWPIKDGWMHFDISKDIPPLLISRVKRFVDQHEIFELEEWGRSLSGKDYFAYTICAHFESHNGGSLFDKLDKPQQKNYFRRAETRHRRILRGWSDLNGIIVQYLSETFRKDYEKLPYK